MEGNLVIVESPGKIKKIEEYLGKDYTVKASIGHIRDLQDNKLSIDVDNGFCPEYVVPADKKKIVYDLKRYADKAQTVWLASDADREGEAISWHLMETLELDPAKTKRIVFHEITKSAIQEAVNNPRQIDMNLVDAQQARRVLDRLVGFELSPVLWKKIQPKLSAGRVQSVALRLVVDKEKEILDFNPTPYYMIEGLFVTQKTGAPLKAVLEKRFASEDEARAFLSDCIGASFSVAGIEEKQSVRVPAAPFTTSTLQQEAARKLHFTVSTTMRVAQSLYERGLITYMRTDSTNLSSLALGTAKKFITENYGAEYSRTRQYKTSGKGAQEAHEAIRPTFIDNTSISGTAMEQKLYNLIWKRTVASQMADASVMNTAVKIDCDRRPERFSAQAVTILFDGFLKIYMESSDDSPAQENETVLPQISVGEKLSSTAINALCKFTQPPLRYSEASLVKKLEELEIGRPSTYSPTITTLTSRRGYLVKGDKEGTRYQVTNLSLKGSSITSSVKTETVGAEKGKLLPMDIGIIVSDYLKANFPGIMDYDFTANVEKDLDKIANGELAWNKVISSFYYPFHKKVEDSLTDGQFNRISREIGTAPDGEVIVARFGRFGAYVQKGDPEKKQFATLAKGQLIESLTLEEALKLFQLPRNLGQIDGSDVIVTKGKFGPYLKFGEKNIALPRGVDPMKINLEECREIISQAQDKVAANAVLAQFKDGVIQVINGRFGPYIKFDGNNYKIPKGVDAASLTLEKCQEIIDSAGDVRKKPVRFKKASK